RFAVAVAVLAPARGDVAVGADGACLYELCPSAGGGVDAVGDQEVTATHRAGGAGPVEGFVGLVRVAETDDDRAVGVGVVCEAVERAAGQIADPDHAGVGGPSDRLAAVGPSAVSDDRGAVEADAGAVALKDAAGQVAESDHARVGGPSKRLVAGS